MKKLGLLFLMLYFVGCLTGCQEAKVDIDNWGSNLEAVIISGEEFISVDIESYELDEETGIIRLYNYDGSSVITSIENVIICDGDNPVTNWGW